MSDDERIARLTKLARRVWPGLEMKIEHSDRVSTVWSMSCDYPGEMVLHVTMREHPRALDALETALLALAGETPQPHWVDELWGRWTAWAMQHESMQARRDPETESLHEGAVLAYRRCASELRARAKEGT